MLEVGGGGGGYHCHFEKWLYRGSSSQSLYLAKQFVYDSIMVENVRIPSRSLFSMSLNYWKTISSLVSGICSLVLAGNDIHFFPSICSIATLDNQDIQKGADSYIYIF